MAEITISELAGKLAPHILDLIGMAGGGSGPYAPTPHDLSSGHHTGSIADGQGPQFLKQDGSRSLLGNLAVASTITIDGVDIDLFKSGYDTHLSADAHTQYLNTSRHDTTARHALGTVVPHDDHGALSGLGDDDHAQYFLASGSRQMAGSILPALSDAYDLGSASALWRRMYASEFDTFVLKANTISVVGGRLMVSKNEGALGAAAAAAATQIDFGTTMAADDFVLFRTLGQVEYMQIVSLASGTTYNVTRNVDGSGANDWPAGAVWVNLGYNGTGRIELDAESTPRIAIKRQGTAYNTLLSEPVRIGDLNGWDTVGTERYGVGVGDFSGGNYLRYEPGSGFVVSAANGGISLDNNGLSVIMPASSYDATKAVQFKYSGTQRAVMQTYFDAGSSLPWLQLKTTGTSGGDAVAQLYTTNQEADFAAFTLRIKSPTTLDVGYATEFRVRGVSGTMTDLNVIGSLTVQNSDAAPNTNLVDGEAGLLSLYLSDLNANIGQPTGTNALRVGNKYGSLLFRRGANIHYASRPADLIAKLAHAYIWGPPKNVGGSTVAVELSGTGNHLTCNNLVYGENSGVNFGNGHPFGYGGFNGTSTSYTRDYAGITAATNVLFFGCWVNLTSVNRAHGLFGLGTSTPSAQCWIDASNYCYFRIYNATTNYSIGTSSGSMTTGWHFIGGMHKWNSTSDYSLRLFIDGTTYTYSGSAPTSGMRTPSGNLTFGYEAAGSAYLYGSIATCMYGYSSANGDTAMQEYYYLTRPEYQ